MIPQKISNFVSRYMATVSCSQTRQHRFDSVWMPINHASASISNEAKVSSVRMYDIKIAEPEFKELLDKLEKFENDEKLIKSNESVRAAWNQYQLTLKLCQPYPTV